MRRTHPGSTEVFEKESRRRLSMQIANGNEILAMRLRRLPVFEVALRGAAAVDEVARRPGLEKKAA